MNWKTYLKKKGARVGAIVVAVVLVLALIAGALGGKAGFLTNLDGIVRAPLQKAATVTAQWLESIYGYIYKYDQLQAENEQLRTQLAEAQAQAREGQEAIAENERYRDLLGFTQRHTDFELEPANVVSYGASNWSSTLTLSKGSDSGIEVGDCVMNESGALVGQVIETGSTWATVRTVIDVDMSVGGYVSGSGATAMVRRLHAHAAGLRPLRLSGRGHEHLHRRHRAHVRQGRRVPGGPRCRHDHGRAHRGRRPADLRRHHTRV